METRDAPHRLLGNWEVAPEDERSLEELEGDRMFQAPAPAPWREAELEYLRKALGLKGPGLL